VVMAIGFRRQSLRSCGFKPRCRHISCRSAPDVFIFLVGLNPSKISSHGKNTSPVVPDLLGGGGMLLGSSGESLMDDNLACT
jgi:hypothetical protein